MRKKIIALLSLLLAVTLFYLSGLTEGGDGLLYRGDLINNYNVVRSQLHSSRETSLNLFAHRYSVRELAKLKEESFFYLITENDRYHLNPEDTMRILGTAWEKIKKRAKESDEHGLYIGPVKIKGRLSGRELFPEEIRFRFSVYK